MTIKAIILDVDDTLISTSNEAFNNLNRTAEVLGIRKITKEEFLKYWGHTTEKMVSEHWPNLVMKKFRKAYNSVAYNNIYPLFEGARETLEYLKDKYVLGILTSRSKTSLPKRFSQVNLSLDYFKFIQTEDDTEFHKPNPKVFGPILKKFNDIGIKNEEILYVGDHVFDAQAALSNNIKFVGVLTGTTKKEDFINAGVKESNILNSIKDLKGWLKNG